MATHATQNVVPSKVDYNSAILSALCFPALIFDITTLKVIESNAYFCEENDVSLNHLLAKYNFNFLKITGIQEIVQCLSAGQNYVENKIDNYNNKTRTFQVNVSLFPDNQKAFLYLNLLSENKFLDFEINESERLETYKKHKTILNQSSLGIYCIKGNAEILYANDTLANILGYSSANDLYEISANHLYLSVDVRIKQLELRKEMIISADTMQLKTKSGQIIWVKDIGRAFLNQQGEIAYFEGIIEDITNSLQMDRELIKARDKAQEADRLKTTFLTNISHEIRTPMNSILGFSSMLQFKGLSRQKREQYLDIIISRGKHLMDLINDILDITKLDEDQVQITPNTCELNELLKELYRNFSSNIKKSNKLVKLIMHTYFSDDQSTIVSDSFHLQQILSNLLNNSEKFTEEGFIEFGYMVEKENNILFYVRDTGIGVPADMHEVIFERFRQADDSFTRIYGGMGLGLSICKGLVTLMGGNIWLESDGKSGSTFYFNIPYHSGVKKSEFQQISHQDYSFLVTKTILIVEDDVPSYEYLKEILSSKGCNVIHAGNGKEALMKFRELKSIDLILLDIQLPGTNGYEIAESIRKTNTDIPIIAQTAHAMPEDRKKCMDAGCNNYITKPILSDKLLSTLKEYLANR